MMTYTEYKNVAEFLTVVELYLQRDECVNSLMLGICRRLVAEPGFDGEQPLLASVTSDGGLHAAALRTPPRKNMHVFAADADSPCGLDALASHLHDSGAEVPAVFAPTPVARAFAAEWTRVSGATPRDGTHQRVHRLESVHHPDYPAGAMRLATNDDMELVHLWAAGFMQDCFHEPPDERTYSDAEKRVAAGTLFFWDDGEPRAMAARNRPTATGECVSFVYTPPEHRNRGYASAVVARLSQQILDEGKSFCTLFTDLGNPTSNSIYRKLGYVGVADFLDITFDGCAS